MLRRLNKNGGRATGVLWYQGCTDAMIAAQTYYTRRMKALIRSIRKETSNQRLPIVITQISRYHNIGLPDPTSWNAIQEQQRLLGETIPYCATVPTIDLELDDDIHLSGRSQIRLGKRLAGAAIALVKNGKSEKLLLPITLEKVFLKPDHETGLVDVHVQFRNVIGKITSKSRPAGFSISDCRGKIYPIIHATKLQSNSVVLRTNIPESLLGGLYLHYGLGPCAYCNITDQQDRSLPVFGPYPLGTPRVVTPFAREMLISDPKPCVQKIEKLKCPNISNRMFGRHFHQFPSDNLTRKQDILKTISAD